MSGFHNNIWIEMCIRDSYHEEKTAIAMKSGVDLLESILGQTLFRLSLIHIYLLRGKYFVKINHREP